MDESRITFDDLHETISFATFRKIASSLICCELIFLSESTEINFLIQKLVMLSIIFSIRLNLLWSLYHLTYITRIRASIKSAVGQASGNVVTGVGSLSYIYFYLNNPCRWNYNSCMDSQCTWFIQFLHSETAHSVMVRLLTPGTRNRKNLSK